MVPTAEQVELHQLCYDGLHRGCAACVPGNTNADVVLRPGMTANLEPYRGKPGVGGFRLENCLIVRDGAPDIYTTYPFDERLVKDVHPLDKTTGRVRR